MSRHMLKPSTASIRFCHALNQWWICLFLIRPLQPRFFSTTRHLIPLLDPRGISFDQLLSYSTWVDRESVVIICANKFAKFKAYWLLVLLAKLTFDTVHGNLVYQIFQEKMKSTKLPLQDIDSSNTTHRCVMTRRRNGQGLEPSPVIMMAHMHSTKHDLWILKGGATKGEKKGSPTCWSNSTAFFIFIRGFISFHHNSWYLFSVSNGVFKIGTPLLDHLQHSTIKFFLYLFGPGFYTRNSIVSPIDPLQRLRRWIAKIYL